jgi:tetraacyldisaccharide 4'-kinase
MVQNLLLKILLFPFSLLYGLLSYLFGVLYDFKLLDSTSFNIPVINVGNLTVGGSGKTPHTEYLIRLLQPYLNVAVLSRGYKRKTRGFKTVNNHDNVFSVGDEPLLYKRKYRDIGVYVDVSRSEGIPHILMKKPDTQVILLDDAYQHRAVKPGLNILLTQFDKPFTRDFFLPSGTLREWRSGYKRADIIVVTKCPPTLTETERSTMLASINPLGHQRVFFSHYQYLNPYYIYNPAYTVELRPDIHVLLVSAIASTHYLMQYLNEKTEFLHTMEYIDHHVFTSHELSMIKRHYEQLPGPNKIILTTEKDATRLDTHRNYILENRLPLFILPVHVAFHFDEQEKFDEQIRQFLLDFKV